ncbi:MAG: tRNA (adenosine(37)-N6)-threonylcarbamoyltransferase complex ATPase subunit type 1 TsaE [Planctomycetota bacterium]
MQIVRETRSPEQCADLARQLSGLLRPGDIVALNGPMGAGKTTLVRGIVRGLGLDTAAVSSPTFVIANEYAGTDGVPPIVHVDAYRLGSSDELDTIGWDRVLDGSAVVLVEWAERIADALPNKTAAVTITPTGATDRRIELTLPRDWAERPGVLRLAEPFESRGSTTCPVTGAAVPADSPTWPFADDRARLADLYRWMHESYTITRAMKDADLEQGIE